MTRMPPMAFIKTSTHASSKSVFIISSVISVLSLEHQILTYLHQIFKNWTRKDRIWGATHKNIGFRKVSVLGFFRATVFINILIVLTLINPVGALRFGITVPPSAGNAIDLVQSVNDYQSRLHSASKLSRKERQLLTEQFENRVTDYITSNTCLRYHLKDHIQVEQLAEKEMYFDMSNILISLDMEINKPIELRRQQLNINVIDRHGNTLRRKTNLQEQNVQMVVDFPLYNHKDDYKSEYFDLCFENINIDQSWRSSPKNIDAYLTIKFGVPEILKTYEENSKNLGSVKSELLRIENDIDQLTAQMRQLLTDESKLRNTNEAILSNFSICAIFTVIVLVVSTVTQLWWFINHMKKKNIL
ncbi:hypothetical protein OGAPHI_006405 [Ogataea philodendri]|uniref:GOLD domain-containing protein n=1 Tax=Ogataea philodendri TaxID=1378263 RepID=A0A9P8NYI9_9ASCO|nr:uncharacterized protein OGAPHI_006405 [Ogataea philodendri]KAH3661557.1 hypothetical protein OGAPHI_006405 [Ogataea philodendri]